jgi:hypothetical protein
MIALAITLAVIGAFLLYVGISTMRSASNNNMPLLFKPLFQQASGIVGPGCLVFGVAAAIGSIVIFVQQIF